MQLSHEAKKIISESIPSHEDKPLKLYDTMRRRVVPFSPLRAGEVRMYTCGPTVYDWPHIGNLRTFTQEDFLRRWLKIKGYKVEQVMNLTDVDDKTIRRSREEGVSLSEYTERYVKAFFQSIDALNLERVEHYPRATDYIPQMVEMIQRLMRKGLAYRSSDGSVYYSVAKFPNYGKLSGLDISKVKPGARVSQDEYEKDSPVDFALWKAWTPEDGDVFWETPIGKGRPGWHIECSVMSTSILGPTLDLHGGGVDLIFPHHENEIAQSEGANDAEFCRHWFHVEHLMVEGQKMSKSLGNIYTVRDITSRGFDPLSLRLFYMQSHYRQKQNFTWESLRSASRALERLREGLKRLAARAAEYLSGGAEFLEVLRRELRAIGEAMDDDLNVPRALGHLFTLIEELSRISEGGYGGEELRLALEVIRWLDERFFALNLFGESVKPTLSESSEEILKRLIHIRAEARRKRNWKVADSIRDDLRKLGIQLEDTKEGTKYRLQPGAVLERLEEPLRELYLSYSERRVGDEER